MVRPEPFAGAKKATKSILVIQLTITLLAALACLVFINLKAAYSACIGGGISIIANLYFAHQVFSLKIGTPPAKIAKRFYVSEAVKLLLTAILLSIAFLWLNISPLPLFLTYMATLMAYWLILPFTLDSSVKTL